MFLEADRGLLDGLIVAETSGSLEGVRRLLMVHLSPISTIRGSSILPLFNGRGWEGAIREGRMGCTAPWAFQIPQTFPVRGRTLPGGPMRAATSGYLADRVSILSAKVEIGMICGNSTRPTINGPGSAEAVHCQVLLQDCRA